jgi:translation elongation factor EF-G
MRRTTLSYRVWPVKIRYIDNREDERERGGTTIETSAVSLRFKVLEKSVDGGACDRRTGGHHEEQCFAANLDAGRVK